ncbi:MAG: hypothetical protein JSS32_10705 [Verrucomicrobia bacterium]|nr:hypothetical protein [Verrucomicrobiota bacterium]
MKLAKVFFVTMGFFLILSALLAVRHQTHFLMADNSSQIDQQIEQIDREIAELEDMKRGYEARAIRHENLGQMQQSESKYTLETRRHYQLAEQNREIAEKIQLDIDRLQEKKQALLKKKKGIFG